MRRPPRVLLVYKKSAYQLYALERRDPKVRSLLRRGAHSVRRLAPSHLAHEETLVKVRQAFKHLGVIWREVYRAHVRSTASYDLVVTVGGDGTLLDASHRVLDVPMLGVNSNPGTSVGYLTTCAADGFERLLESILSGRLKPQRIMRLDVLRNGRSLGVPVLNDILFCHTNPAAMSRYLIRQGGQEEEHKSSGIWISTAAGSTAAMASAGGKVQRMGERRFQWRVREPYVPPGQRVAMVGGMVVPPARLRVDCHVRNAAVFVDGAHLRFPMGMGDRLEIVRHSHDLHIFRTRP